MKFSFDKVPTVKSTQEEVETSGENLKELLTQEEFDKQCIEEADKLGVNIGILQSEIDAMGGPDKIKEEYEKHSQSGDMNKAEYELDKLSRDSKYQRLGRNLNVAAATVVGGFAAFVDSKILGQDGMGISDQIESIKDAWERSSMEGSTYTFFAAVVVMLSAGAGALAVGAIKKQLEARRLDRKKKIEALKFKMTDTQVR